MELLPIAWSFSQNENFVCTSKNFLKNRNLIFAVVRYFTWMKTRVCVKYFVNNCGCSNMDMDGFNPVTASSR